jgi:hypothetical protein
MPVLIAGGLYSCSVNNLTGSETGNPSVISSAVLIRMPTSLTSAISSRSKDNADNIYSFIRAQNHFVNQLVNGGAFSIKWVIDSLVAPLPWNYIQQLGTWKDTSTDSVVFEATYRPGDTLKYIVILESLKKKPFKIKAAFNGNSADPSGWVYYHIGTPEETFIDSQTIKVTFKKTEISKSLDVEIVQALNDTTATPKQKKEFARAFRYSLLQQQETIYLSAGANFPYLDSILKDTIGYCYTYTAVSDTAANRSIIKLGIPPMHCPSNDSTIIFETYGIASIYGKAFINYSIPGLKDTIKSIIVTSYKENMRIDTILYKIFMQDTTLKLHPDSEIVTMTVADLKHFLELNKDVDPVSFSTLLWILKLEQPVYFSALGYAGNGKIVPVGFTILAKKPSLLPIFIPEKVTTLTIQP